MPGSDDKPSEPSRLTIKATLPISPGDGYETQRRLAEEILEHLRRAGWQCEIVEGNERGDH